MTIGLLCALGAGLMWGLVFVAPLMLADYPGIVLSLGRYISFGGIALVLAFFDRRRLAALSRADWMVAFKLSLVGNIVYYGLLATAIQLADVPLPAMLIGTLPVVISICSNWTIKHDSGRIPWRRLALSLVVIFIGLMLVNAGELAHLDRHRAIADYACGCIISIGAVAAWTWYPIVNATHLNAHPHIASSTWATAQGLTTLPLALIGFALYGAYNGMTHGVFAFPLGDRPGIFAGLALVLGLCASWLGTVLWNHASQRLPTSLAGQLIVFETLSALAYAFILRGTMPALPVAAGALMLCCGVAAGVRLAQPGQSEGDDTRQESIKS